MMETMPRLTDPSEKCHDAIVPALVSSLPKALVNASEQMADGIHAPGYMESNHETGNADQE